MELSEEQKTFFSNAFSDFLPFIDRFDFEREPIFVEMETEEEVHLVNIIGPWFGRLLSFLVRFGRAGAALEFGTGTGYSAIWIAKGLPENGHLVTIESDSRRVQLARRNIAKAGLGGKISIREGDAHEVVSTLTQTFDFVFVDCAHLVALESSQRLLRQGGLFVCDNVGVPQQGGVQRGIDDVFASADSILAVLSEGQSSREHRSQCQHTAMNARPLENDRLHQAWVIVERLAERHHGEQ